jgi:hypothetical protein
LNRLSNEASVITKKLGDVIFIGALHTCIQKAEETQDLDFVTEKPLSDDELLSKDYKKSIT